MPRTAPWHARAESQHHDNTECLYAGLVESGQRVPGDGGKPLCQLCARLDRAEDQLAGKLER